MLLLNIVKLEYLQNIGFSCTAFYREFNLDLHLYLNSHRSLSYNFIQMPL